MATNNYEDAFVQNLFDRMGPTYDIVNLVSSFGFSEWWRLRCVRAAGISQGSLVCDMMSGSGECWRYILNRGGSVVSVDFSRGMSNRQSQRNTKIGGPVDIRCENALHTSINSDSVDFVVSAFGLKTLNRDSLESFAAEIRRILRPGGRFSLLEISTAEAWVLGPIFRWYVNRVVPMIGKLLLGDIECYRMLGRYTNEFKSCDHVLDIFKSAGLEVAVQRHFCGCATSLVGAKQF
jgi:ubiquinone/menaquinone biosynthesis methyltransferase